MNNGKDIYNSMVNDNHAAKMMKDLEDICPDFIEMTKDFAMGQVFSRPALDLKTRELCIISICAAMGDFPDHIKAHIEIALDRGATRSEIIETILQTMLYAGFARTSNALRVAKTVLN